MQDLFEQFICIMHSDRRDYGVNQSTKERIRKVVMNNYGDTVRRFLEGDETAFNILYEETYKDEYYVALKYMKNEDDARDVLQDAYIKAYEKLGTISDPNKFASWLSMIVANTAKNALVKKKPVLFTQLESENEEGENIVLDMPEVDPSKQPEIAYTDSERNEIINQMIDSLSDEQRMCIMMFYMEGLSIKEIAQTLELNENTVKTRLNLGRKNIKAAGEALQKKGYNFFGVLPFALFVFLLQGSKETFACEVPAIAAGSAATTSASATSATTASAANTAAGIGIASKIAVAIAGLAIMGAVTFGTIFILAQLDKKQNSGGDDNNSKVHASISKEEVSEFFEDNVKPESPTEKKEDKPYAQDYMDKISEKEEEYSGETLYYDLVYIDKDDYPELIISRDYTDPNWPDTIYTETFLYTYKNGELVSVFTKDGRESAWGVKSSTDRASCYYNYYPKANGIFSNYIGMMTLIDCDSTIYYIEDDGSLSSIDTEKLKYDPNSENGMSDAGDDWVYWKINNESVTEEEFNKIVSEHETDGDMEELIATSTKETVLAELEIK